MSACGCRVNSNACGSDVGPGVVDCEHSTHVIRFCDRHSEAHVAALEAQVARCQEAAERITKELGIPQPGYPAPVSNAYQIATEILRGLDASEQEEQTP